MSSALRVFLFISKYLNMHWFNGVSSSNGAVVAWRRHRKAPYSFVHIDANPALGCVLNVFGLHRHALPSTYLQTPSKSKDTARDHIPAAVAHAQDTLGGGVNSGIEAGETLADCLLTEPVRILAE